MAHARHHHMHAAALVLTFGLLAAGLDQCSPRPAHAQENSNPAAPKAQLSCAPAEAVEKNAAGLGFVAAAKWTGSAGETYVLFINPKTRDLEIMISPPGRGDVLCDGPAGTDFRPAKADRPAPPVRHGHPSGQYNI